MLFTGITPIHEFNGIWVKREDLAYWSDLKYPSGSKVRQYLDMAHRSIRKEGFPPCLVGCSANSCQQIYVAAAAKQLNTRGIIYTAKRKIRSSATDYCASLGAEIVEVKPAYLSVVRKQARQRAIDEKHVIEWDRIKAVEDTAAQYKNIPEGVKRIVIPTGSGLTAAGILVGMLQQLYSPITKRDFISSSELDIKSTPIEIVIIATSPMASKTGIERLAMRVSQSSWVPDITFINPTIPYDTPVTAKLPDGTPLDPFYAAKAWRHVKSGDLLWPPGLRPVTSMPEECRHEFKDWEGPSDENKV